jgi:hypothetical protein
MNLTMRQKIIGAAVIIIGVALFGWCEKRSGIQSGALSQEIKASAVVVNARKADVAVQLKKSVAKRAEYKAARAKVTVKGDTVIADGQSVVMPSVANLVKIADSRGEQDSTSMAKQDLLVGALDHHVDLVQEMKKPRIGVKTGIAIGVVGTVAVVYIGVKIIKALGHK